MVTEMDVKLACEKVKDILNSYGYLLCHDAIKEINNYLMNNEPEIAYEGFLLELLAEEKIPNNVDREAFIIYCKVHES